MTDSKFDIGEDVTISTNPGVTFVINAKDVTIGEGSVIDATITATDKVDIKGDVTVNGDITAKDVVLEEDSTVNGNVIASDSLDVKSGAVINGDCPPWNYPECTGGATMNNPTVTALTTFDTTPIVSGTYTSAVATELTVNVNSVTYTLSTSSELTNSGDNWTLDLSSISPLAIGTYEVVATSTDGSSSLSDLTSNELVIEVTPICLTFRDEFSSRSYGRNDGTGNWLADWDEGNDSGGPTGGDVLIRNVQNDLRIRDDSRSISRGADLSTFSSATLSFDYEESSLDSSLEYVELEIRTGGSGGWTFLQRFEGPTNESGSVSMVIDGHISSNTEIRFATALANMGNGDLIFIDNVQIEACNNLPAIDHFVIDVGAGAANACSAYPVTITAKDSSNDTITDYDGTVSITTSTSNGNFAAGSPAPTNNLNPNPDNDDNGSVGYSFDSADNGVIALTISNPHIESLTITVNDTSDPITSISSTIAFAEAGFSIVDIDSMAVSDVPVAGRDHAFRITALRLDPVNGCGTATGYSGAKDLKLWRSTDPSTIDPTLGGYALTDSEPGSTSSVTFSSGIADVSLATADIGKFVINIADRTGLFTVADISGSSTEQTIRPFGIGVTNIVGLIANPNPLVATSTDPIFATAGGDFSATVSAVLWDASDDTNNDGLLDTGTYAGNTVAPGYDWNTPWVISGFEPNLGTAGVLANADFNNGGFTNGAQTVTTLSYDEVGSFTFQATATNFLGTPGVDPPAESIVVGRFIPASFSVSANTDGVLGETCTAFTYIGQPFGYETNPSNQAPTFTVTALNVGLQPTGNYREDWAELDGSSVTATANQDSGNSLQVSYTPAAAMTANKANDNSGQVNYTFGADIFRYGPESPITFAKYSNSQVAPFFAAPNLTITNIDDGEVSQPGGVNVSEAVTFLAGNSVSLRFGRLAMSNVHGSELINLVMPVSPEYWNGFSFQKNTIDTCTAIVDANLNSVPPAFSVPAVDNALPVAGDIDYIYPSPGAGNTGSVDTTTELDTASHLWLRYDWDADGEFDNDPAARATFGIFEGNPVQIYIQQIYE